MCPARVASTRLSSKTDAKAVLFLMISLGVSACHATPRPAVAPPPPTANAVARLHRDIDTVLASPALERSYWGILIRSLKNDNILYSLNAGKLLMPGSTMKIVTLAAAAERLGWDHTWDTQLVAMGPVADGVLTGDLVVVGSGDPSIASDSSGPLLFDRWAELLKSNGVRVITGRVVGNDNAFDDEALGPGWAWDDLQGRDATGVSGLQYNENVVQATIMPAMAVGAPATVTFAPAESTLELDNRLVTSAAGATPSIVARRSPGSNLLELRGSIPLDSEPVLRFVSVDNPTLFFVTALRSALTTAGIEVRGAAVDIDDLKNLDNLDNLNNLTGAPQPAGGTVLAINHSPPLSTLALRLMKTSQNLYGETLLKTIGGSGGEPTLENGRLVVGATLLPWGVAPTGLVQVDGSGLSRYNYVTAETLVTVLLRVDRDERMRAAFEGSLPIAGSDGTLAARMKGTAAEGNVRAKSGTLANVRSLAGYVTAADGEPLVFAIIANNYGTMPEVAMAAIEAIVVKLAEFRR